jgi:hypothetical protein
MARRRSLTSNLYRAGRPSSNPRVIGKSPLGTAERLARQKTYSKSIGASGRVLRMLRLK